MLFEFIAMNREDIVSRTRKRVRGHAGASGSDREIEHGVPLFLTQLADTLRLETTAEPFSSTAVGATATRHGAELLAARFNVAQVVHDYGDACQAITEIAIEQHASITVEEFHTLNRCLGTAIAEAVTEHTRRGSLKRSEEEVELLGQAAHELRNLRNGALLAFHALKRGTVAINGNTGAVLGRSLTSLQDLVERTLSEVRLVARKQRPERLTVTPFVDEIAATGVLHSEYRGVGLTVLAVDPGLAVDGDPQLLASAVMNALQNAFKYTPRGEPSPSVHMRTRDVCSSRSRTNAAAFQSTKAICFKLSGTAAVPIAPVSGSGSRSRGRPCERTPVTSTSGTCRGRAASLRPTSRWPRKTRTFRKPSSTRSQSHVAFRRRVTLVERSGSESFRGILGRREARDVRDACERTRRQISGRCVGWSRLCHSLAPSAPNRLPLRSLGAPPPSRSCSRRSRSEAATVCAWRMATVSAGPGGSDVAPRLTRVSNAPGIISGEPLHCAWTRTAAMSSAAL